MDPAQVIADQSARIRELETRETQTAINSAIGGALDAAGLPLATGAREQLTKLLGGHLAVVPDATGGRAVVAPGGSAVNDWVKAQLTQGSYSHFVRGGATTASIAAPPLPTGEPKNMSEAVFLQHRAAAAARPQGNETLDIRLPFGLKPKR
jgi:hypothetical protein